MAKQDRKTRLRPLQQTAQIQTGGLPSISSYQPKAAPQGKSNEAQMANALAQLAPSLTEFLGTKFQSDKKAGIAKGRATFRQQTTEERKETQRRIALGNQEGDEFFVEGYQRSWLKNLGRAYGLGLTSMLDKIPKDLSDAEFFEAIEKYDQEFQSTNGLDLYDKEFYNEEFVPTQEQFKNVIQQAWGAQRRQLLSEQADAAYQQNLVNSIDEVGNNLSTITNGQINDLSELLDELPTIIESLKAEGVDVPNENDFEGILRRSFQVAEEDPLVNEMFAKDKKGEYIGINKDIQQSLENAPAGSEGEKAYKKYKNYEKANVLHGLRKTIADTVNKHADITGDYSQANNLAATQIAELALQKDDVDLLKLIDFITTKNGASWGTSGPAIKIKRVYEDKIKQNIINKANQEYTLKQRKEEELKKSAKANTSKILRGIKRDESGRLIIDSVALRALEMQIETLEDLGERDEARKLRISIGSHTTLEEELALRNLEIDVSTGNTTTEKIREDGALLGLGAKKIGDLEKELTDKQYRDRIFKKDSLATVARNDALKLITKKPVGAGKSLEDWFAEFNQSDPKDIERVRNAHRYRRALLDYGYEKQKELKEQNPNISQADLDDKLSRAIADKALDQNFLKSYLIKEDEDNTKLSIIQTHPNIVKLPQKGFIAGTFQEDKFPYTDKNQYLKDRDSIYLAFTRNKFSWKTVSGAEVHDNRMVQMINKLLEGEGGGSDGTMYSNFLGKPDEAFSFLAQLLDEHFNIPDANRLKP